MKMLRKIMDCESFRSSQENLLDGVYFCKVASLQCTDCTSTINRLYHRFFSENVSKASCLKITFFVLICVGSCRTRVLTHVKLVLICVDSC